MPDNYGVKPIAPKKRPQAAVENTAAVQWSIYANLVVNPDTAGWMDTEEAINAGGLLIADDGGNLTAFTGTVDDMEKDPAVFGPIQQAGIEGRLFLRHKTSGKPMQLQTEKEDGIYTVSLTEPLEELPTMEAYHAEVSESEEFAERDFEEESIEEKNPFLDGEDIEVEESLSRGADEGQTKEWLELLNDASWGRGDWKSLKEALNNGAVYIYGEKGNCSTVIGTYETLHEDERLRAYFLDASANGQLWYKPKGSEQLRQIKTDYINAIKKQQPIDPDYVYPYMKEGEAALPVEEEKSVLEEPVLEEPAVLEKPEKPGLWTRFVAFLFKNSAAAEKVRAYEEALEAYNAQQAKLNSPPETEEIKVEESAPEELAFEAVKEEKVGEKTIQNTIDRLDRMLKAGLPNKPAGGGAGYGYANLAFKKGVGSRSSLLGFIKDGVEPRENWELEENLGYILVGEMVNRAVMNKTPEEAKKFYDDLSDGGIDQLSQWEREMMDTQAVRDLLNADDEELKRVLGSETNFSRWVNSALIQTQKEKQQDLQEFSMQRNSVSNEMKSSGLSLGRKS